MLGACAITLSVTTMASDPTASIHGVTLASLGGEPDVLSRVRGKVALVVNVASRCGLTPQYEGLEALHARLAPRGFAVLGVPCNQFGAQEPGTPEEIRTFCSTTYGVTFPMSEKVEVNGTGRHELYRRLVGVADAEGHTGDVRWNFEKFLVARDGSVLARFAPMTSPDDAALGAAIEGALA